MRIVVAGGAGFIGHHLVTRLLADGHSVIVVDDLSTGTSANIPNHPNVQLHVDDVRYLDTMHMAETYWPVDRIYNLASPASPVHYQKDPLRTLMVNIEGTERMLSWAYITGARFLQASTSEVYGDPLEHPQQETYYGNVNTVGNRSCYDEGKRAAETMVMSYHNQKGLDTRIARIFNTYGPRMQTDDGRIISEAIVKMLKRQTITVFGDGSQTRSCCYVSDLVEGLITLMEANQADLHPSVHYPVNLGNPDDELSVNGIISLVSHLLQVVPKIKYRDIDMDDPRKRRPDINLAKEYGWMPKVKLDAGLAQTVEYFKTVV